MIGILILAHTPLASAFLEAAKHVFKNTPPSMAIIDVVCDEDVDMLFERAMSAVQSVDTGDGVLVLADVCGATPANCGQRVVDEYPNARLLFGLNVPMLLRAINYRELPLAQLAAKAAEGGKSCIEAYRNTSPEISVGA
ncbi:MAG: PTS sugar transporter subunit IIA [Formosimonas sp.]|mgnify:FL=1